MKLKVESLKFVKLEVCKDEGWKLGVEDGYFGRVNHVVLQNRIHAGGKDIFILKLPLQGEGLHTVPDGQ